MVFMFTRKMASLARIRPQNLMKKVLFMKHDCNHLRFISTSKKNKDTASVIENVCKPTIDFEKPDLEKNWVSYGFDYEDKKLDEFGLHISMFAGISLLFVIGGFYLYYYPDVKEKDWIQREAYLELRRREALGLPYIDCNYIPVENIILPADEDLKEEDIII